jgi:hypothetical protein
MYQLDIGLPPQTMMQKSYLHIDGGIAKDDVP